MSDIILHCFQECLHGGISVVRRVSGTPFPETMLLWVVFLFRVVRVIKELCQSESSSKGF